LVATAYNSLTAEEPREVKGAGEHPTKGVALGKSPEESEAKGKLEEPLFGYVGLLGTFEACTKSPSGEAASAQFVVHHHPHQDEMALGYTKLRYQGAKRLGNVDGWVFNTEWDGKEYPSKVFLSAEPVYFGGGMVNYIAADYRTETGWAWKLLPLRRMELTGGKATTAR